MSECRLPAGYHWNSRQNLLGIIQMICPFILFSNFIVPEEEIITETLYISLYLQNFASKVLTIMKHHHPVAYSNIDSTNAFLRFLLSLLHFMIFQRYFNIL